MAIKKYATAKGVDFKYAKGRTDIYGNTFHNHFELYLLLSGKVSLITDQSRTVLCPYQLAIIPPEQFHQFIIEDNVEEYERCVLNLAIDFIAPAILKASFSGKKLLSLSHNGRIVHDMLYLKEQLDHGNDSDLTYLIPALATDIIFCIKHTENCLNSSSSGIGKLSQEIMNYINLHYNGTIDLKKLSKTFHISISTLCHLFKSDFGITVKQYIMQKRLNAARMALLHGDKSEEVCQRVGFTCYSAFFRAYKKQFGSSPSKT